jgi:alkylation response protein AidB-like acyl-CoA dehydrogenase
MEGFGEGADDWGFVCSVGSHMVIGEIPIWEWGTDQQKMKYLPRMCSGEWVGAFALTEPDAGSDAASIRTKAERKGDYYVLNGSKTFITNGPIADVILVFATQDRSKGKKGILALMVEKNFSGVSTSTLEKMGLKASPMGEIFFDDCKVPAENILGREGEGFAVAMSTLEWERTAILPAHVGHAERRLKEAIAYAKKRIQFGKPIAEFQAIQHKLADMKMWLEMSRLMFYRVAWKKKNGIPALLDASIAKLFFTETNRMAALNAFQIHGTYGYMKEYPIERDMRDTLPGTIGSGTSEMQRLIIARELLKSG